MSFFAALKNLFTRRSTAVRKPIARNKFRPELERLEDRWVPSTLSTIASNFNGTAIPAGDTVWFNAATKVSGLNHAGTVNIHVTNQEITFSAGGTNYTVDVPDSNLTFAPTTTTATLTFNAAENAWVGNFPSSYSGNAFLGAGELQVPQGLPGGVKPVTWSANFTTDTPGVSLNWQWGAAVYANFSTDYAALNVKPLDGPGSVTVYNNSDHAGTPEAYTSFVVGGARGGGGSNWTGSYSSTASLTPEVEQSASISGSVLNTSNGAGFAGVTITLSGTDENGDLVTLTAVTDDSGFYQFTNVEPGTYILTASTPSGYNPSASSAGTVNGTTDGSNGTTRITNITLDSGDMGINYDFHETKSGGSIGA